MAPEKRVITDVQFITYARLARDVQRWAMELNPEDYSGVWGLPRSGLTVAHMLGAALNLPANQVNCRGRRQTTARPVRENPDTPNKPVLVVDDCCSYGVAINDARRRITRPAVYGAVYARAEGRENCRLDLWHATHGEPDILVVTEWNWCHHQDTHYISVTDDIFRHCRPSQPFHRVYPATPAGLALAIGDESSLVVTGLTTGPQKKPVIQLPDYRLVVADS